MHYILWNIVHKLKSDNIIECILRYILRSHFIEPIWLKCAEKGPTCVAWGKVGILLELILTSATRDPARYIHISTYYCSGFWATFVNRGPTGKNGARWGHI